MLVGHVRGSEVEGHGRERGPSGRRGKYVGRKTVKENVGWREGVRKGRRENGRYTNIHTDRQVSRWEGR